MFRNSSETLSAIFGDKTDERGTRSADLFTSSFNRLPKLHEAQWLTEEDDLRLPHIIVPAEFDVEDFFVSVATYYPNYAPLTAFVHVLDKETLAYYRRCCDKDAVSPPVRAVSQWRLASLGAAIGETYLLGINTTDGGALPSYAACKRSLAYTLCRAKTLYPFCDLDYVIKRWARLRRLPGLGVTPASMATVHLTHAVLFNDERAVDATRLPLELHDAIRDYLKGSCSEDRVTAVIESMYAQIAQHANELRGPFDARMKAFIELTRIIHSSSRGPDADSVSIAFLCNLILPGSFDHAKVLAKLVDLYPTALIWYGIFSAVSSAWSESGANYGLISKLIRDIRQLFAFDRRPECDIGLDELEVLVRVSPRPESIRPTHQKIASVALLPGVDVLSRISAESDSMDDRERDRKATEAGELNTRVSRILEEALLLLRRNRPYDATPSSARPRRVRRDK